MKRIVIAALAATVAAPALAVGVAQALPGAQGKKARIASAMSAAQTRPPVGGGLRT